MKQPNNNSRVRPAPVYLPFALADCPVCGGRVPYGRTRYCSDACKRGRHNSTKSNGKAAYKRMRREQKRSAA